MKLFRYMAYQPEHNLSPRVFSVVLVALDIIFVFLAQLVPFLAVHIDYYYSVYLLVFGYALVGFLLDLFNTRLSRWYIALVGTLIPLVLCRWFELPEALFLLVIPVILMASMTNVASSAMITLAASAGLVVFRAQYYPELEMSFFVLVLFACWANFGILVSIYVPIGQHAIWMNEHFVLSDKMLREARERKVDLEQALEGQANANRQLALANKKMAILSKMADDSQQAKSMFVVNVSHEFRTPLNMIIGLVDLMIRNPENYDVVLSPKMREDFAVIYRNCEHLSNMVSDVLDLTRVETGRLVLYREWLDLREIIDKGITVVRPLLEKKNLYMKVEIGEDLPNIYCDRVRTQQVILNLLSNAARFTDKGGLTLVVTHTAKQVTLQVSDTGTGIPAEDRERIFEPFWQGRDPMWQKKGGSGIGLSLSREFVLMHGGHMWFESEFHHGTSFFFTLPISPLIEPLARPGHLIKDDWVWKETAFRSAKVSAAEEIVKPRVIVYDETDTLYQRFIHYTDKVEFVNIPDIQQVECEGMAKAFIINAPSLDKLWGMAQIAVNNATPTTVIGCSVPGEYRRALETGAAGYLIKPLKMEDMKRILDTAVLPRKDILLVDDDLEVLSLYQRMIQTLIPDIRVRTASSGANAIEEIARMAPDLMFLDIVMPDINGWQVLEKISAEMGEQRFPIYFITAQDPVDHLMSGYILATIKGGISLGKLLNISLEIASLLMGSEREPDPASAQNPEDESVLI